LSQRQLVSEINSASRSSHILFPRVRSGFSATSSFFFSSEGSYKEKINIKMRYLES
jgi:hypothetical protein